MVRRLFPHSSFSVISNGNFRSIGRTRTIVPFGITAKSGKLYQTGDLLRYLDVSWVENNMDRANSHAITLAADWLRQGKLVAFPTETVYGLGGDAAQPAAVARIFRAKGRPSDHPLIVHLPSAGMLNDWAVDIPQAAWQLAEAFWPGPLTLILPRGPLAADCVTGGLATVGIRVPSHPVAMKLLQAFEGGIAAPSANLFGGVSPTSAAHVRAEGFDPAEVMILEGEACEVGLESTIVDLSGKSPAILRPGAVTAEQIEDVLRLSLRDADEQSPRCSGRLESHYAPRGAVRIIPQENAADLTTALRACLSEGLHRVVVIAVPEILATLRNVIPREQQLPAPVETEVYARELYALLREADAVADVIFIVPPAEVGVGVAIWDRLRKASAPRI